MAGRWSDEHIAASLHRMGLPTGQAVGPDARRGRGLAAQPHGTDCNKELTHAIFVLVATEADRARACSPTGLSAAV